MARPSRRYVEELAKEWEPRVRQAFLDAVRDIRANVKITALVEMLERGDVNGALRTVGLDPDDYRLLENSIAQVFNAGGVAAAQRIPPVRNPDGYRLQIQFNVRNTAAEDWLRQHSARFITEITDDTSSAIRGFLTARMMSGDNPRTTALDLVGKINPMSGRREGGVIGLTSQQEAWARAYEAELADPGKLKKALKRGLRDRRFDRSILKAAKEGRTISPEIARKMVVAYRNNALRYRAETIARTETLAALGQSGEEAYRQAVDKGVVDVEAVTKVWRTAGDERVRHSHRQMNGQQVGLNENFVTPSGALLRYPCDPLGPIEEIANCRCYCETRIDHLRGLR